MIRPLLRGAALAALIALAPATAFAADYVIHAGRLIDGTSETVRQKVSILVHDERIQAVEPGFVTRPGAAVIDLSDETVMPGFIDCHVHIGAKLPGRTN